MRCRVPARTAAYRWGGLITPASADLLEETDSRTFALCEVMVREPWRGAGVARTLHEELLSHRIEEGHPRARALYERLGYSRMGTVRPYPDGPRYDSMLRTIA
ncbi:GNAT family N-acetyltransferase [Kitasatospora sp. SUK 42]|uniref:GNAT family N-acetyltransferase n=1 Tax=Kitasatospora sp. SUK 42 TaxID=1588882 RepID=UPI0018CADE6D|nr:GNAT family N-acetyltransferase [Kitasatospora sp. SUK 42]MBV2155090.1 GNAT family N-acetyltransferase [Kitasatospora sp. SUK 42]